ncbi:MAG: RES domain-containing protein [Rhodothalassiaceae bacterium]
MGAAHLSDYDACQQLEAAARHAGIDLIQYGSVRDPLHRPNAAILSCAVFAASKPGRMQSWWLWFGASGVQAVREFPRQSLGLPPELWAADPRLSGMRWDRAP